MENVTYFMYKILFTDKHDRILVVKNSSFRYKSTMIFMETYLTDVRVFHMVPWWRVIYGKNFWSRG